MPIFRNFLRVRLMCDLRAAAMRQVLLLVAFSRWRVERCFEDQKQEVGLDQWEGRRWLGLKRHLILTSISYLFLARVRKGLRGEKSGTHGLPGACRGSGLSAELLA